METVFDFLILFVVVVFIYAVITSLLPTEKKEIIRGKIISTKESHGRLGLPDDPDAPNDMYILVLLIRGEKHKFSISEDFYRKLDDIPNLLGSEMELTTRGKEILKYKVKRPLEK